MMNEINPSIARRIIETVGSTGTPPEYGFQFFSVGLEPYLSVIDKEYLASFIQEGGSVFKMIVGVYGGGKTHFLYCVRDIAWKEKFVVSYVSLSPGESPFHQLHLVYATVMRNLMPPLSHEELLTGYEQGIEAFLRACYSSMYKEAQNQNHSREEIHDEILNRIESIQGLESISFERAIKTAFKALLEGQDEVFADMCQWLLGEGYDRRIHGRHGVLHRVNRTTAMTMLRSLGQFLRQMGFSGLVFLLDEAERVPSLSSRQREQHLSNLREIIDECAHANFKNIMILYAVPDENFLEGRTQVYEALRQRVNTVFEEFNPSGVKIQLEGLIPEPEVFLNEVGLKLADLFEKAYSMKLPEDMKQQAITDISNNAYQQRFGDIGYKRLFVQKVIRAFHFIRKKNELPNIDEV